MSNIEYIKQLYKETVKSYKTYLKEHSDYLKKIPSWETIQKKLENVKGQTKQVDVLKGEMKKYERSLDSDVRKSLARKVKADQAAAAESESKTRKSTDAKSSTSRAKMSRSAAAASPDSPSPVAASSKRSSSARSKSGDDSKRERKSSSSASSRLAAARRARSPSPTPSPDPASPSPVPVRVKPSSSQKSSNSGSGSASKSRAATRTIDRSPRTPEFSPSPSPRYESMRSVREQRVRRSATSRGSPQSPRVVSRSEIRSPSPIRGVRAQASSGASPIQARYRPTSASSASSSHSSRVRSPSMSPMSPTSAKIAYNLKKASQLFAQSNQAHGSSASGGASYPSAIRSPKSRTRSGMRAANYESPSPSPIRSPRQTIRSSANASSSFRRDLPPVPDLPSPPATLKAFMNHKAQSPMAYNGRSPVSGSRAFFR